MSKNFIDMGEQGLFGVCSYLVPTDNGGAVLIDAPYGAERINNYIESKGLKLKAILLTHGHCDHIESVNKLNELTGCEVYIHSEDAIMLRDKQASLAKYFSMPMDAYFGEVKTLDDGDIIEIDGKRFKVISTPGHTKGSVCYQFEDTLFTGDTLFPNSVGRTDFPGGDFDELMRSIKKLCDMFPEDIEFYSGHSCMYSSVLYELKHNPFLEAVRNAFDEV